MSDGAAAEPAGFGNCGSCPLMQSGTVAICAACAERSFGPPGKTCLTCDGALDESGTCRNNLCRWSVDERYFTTVMAVSSNTGPLRDAIHRYKYRDKWGWRLIFGRVLAGHLQTYSAVFAEYDLIVPSPTFVGPGGRSRDHIAEMVSAMEQESVRVWPVSYRAISKTAPTPKMADTSSWSDRFRIARTQLRASLLVPDRTLVDGKSILVIDDVFTGGLTLMEVARALRRAGAVEVSELVLARQPWAS